MSSCLSLICVNRAHHKKVGLTRIGEAVGGASLSPSPQPNIPMEIWDYFCGKIRHEYWKHWHGNAIILFWIVEVYVGVRNIKHPVAFLWQHLQITSLHHIMFSHLWSVWFCHIFVTLINKCTAFQKKKKVCEFWIYLRLLSKTSLHPGRIQRHSIINAKESSCKVHDIFLWF